MIYLFPWWNMLPRSLEGSLPLTSLEERDDPPSMVARVLALLSPWKRLENDWDDVIATSDMLATGARGVTLLSERANHVMKSRMVMPQSIIHKASKVFELTVGLGLAWIQSPIENVFQMSAECFKNNQAELEYLNDVAQASEMVSTNLHLFDGSPLKTWEHLVMWKEHLLVKEWR